MKKKIPFNSGDLVMSGSYGNKKYMIVGHVWWPVEQTNAYYCLPADEYGGVTSEEVQYMWDSTHQFSLYAPRVAA